MSFSAALPLPLFVRGTVVQGFGRGSKQLGCPTGIRLVAGDRPDGVRDRTRFCSQFFARGGGRAARVPGHGSVLRLGLRRRFARLQDGHERRLVSVLQQPTKINGRNCRSLSLLFSISLCSRSPQETHILRHFSDDFYGAQLKVCVVKYLRPEMNFSSLDRLIAAIERDKKDADESLDEEENSPYRHHQYFTPQPDAIRT